MRKEILIYRDYGCSNVDNLEHNLKQYFEPDDYTVGFTDAAGIIHDNQLNDEVLAFFMPGGAGTPFRHKLAVCGNDKIRDYVFNGGNYYGICAGAYYACSKTIFEADIPELKIISECGLNLVDGRAVGTLYKELAIKPYDKNAASAAVVNLIWQDNKQYSALYHGGPYFELSNADNTEILAVYDLDKPLPAIIKHQYGKGSVILSGVHYEDSAEALRKTLHKLRIDSQEATQVIQKLSENEVSRQQLFNRMMSLAGTGR